MSDRRLSLAAKRLIAILRTHSIATARTLEQKISDAGPTNQRIDPHVLTVARKALLDDGTVAFQSDGPTRWYYLTATPKADVDARFAELRPIHRRLQEQPFLVRMGQSLEIAVYRSLLTAPKLPFFGAYTDLDDHDDSTPYSKDEPPSALSGKRIPGAKKLDFLLLHNKAGAAGIEVKNLREWMYPDRDEVRALLAKCCSIEAVPVLIARRIPFVTFAVLNQCGVVIHQTYRQRFPRADDGLATLARDKRLLAYHDVLVGNESDRRLDRFLSTNLPKVLPRARKKFDQYHDLLRAYGSGSLGYKEFAARAGRRTRGENEDGDYSERD